MILGLEMSRLARSCKDWHQLIELCAMFRVLLADPDGLYDPTDHNDRLLLGLTGIMSEAELHLLRGRMRQGLLNKVRRGEVFMGPSVGYVRSPEGGFEFDPDEQVRTVVRMVFDQFERLGTIRKVLRYLLTNDESRLDRKMDFLGPWIEKQVGLTASREALRVAVSVNADYLETAFEVIRERHGSLDAAIREAQHNELGKLTASLPDLRAVAFNGTKSAAVGTRLLIDSGVALISLPSSSPANASCTTSSAACRSPSMR